MFVIFVLAAIVGNCEGGSVWNECSATHATTCANPNSANVSIDTCSARCECPHPTIWDRLQRVSQTQHLSVIFFFKFMITFFCQMIVD
jgi:hypothetical protein